MKQPDWFYDDMYSGRGSIASPSYKEPRPNDVPPIKQQPQPTWIDRKDYMREKAELNAYAVGEVQAFVDSNPDAIAYAADKFINHDYEHPKQSEFIHYLDRALTTYGKPTFTQNTTVLMRFAATEYPEMRRKMGRLQRSQFDKEIYDIAPAKYAWLGEQYADGVRVFATEDTFANALSAKRREGYLNRLAFEREHEAERESFREEYGYYPDNKNDWSY